MLPVQMQPRSKLSPMRFLHVADIHLGFRQYGSTERFNDCSRLLLHIIRQTIGREIDLLLDAGDLHEKRTADPLAMRVGSVSSQTTPDPGLSWWHTPRSLIHVSSSGEGK